MADTLVERKITYTYTAPNGAVVVITSVPALCDDEGDDEFCGFTEEVSEQISALIDAALASNPQPGNVIAVEFADEPERIRPEVDLEVKVSGPGLVLGQIPVNLLQKLFDNIDDAYRRAASALAKQQDTNPPPPPQVAFLASGSLIIGLRSSDSRPLFPEKDLGRAALGLILQGAELASMGAPEVEDPDIAVAAIEAMKQLAPGPREGFKVELVEYSNHKKERSAILTPALKEKGSVIIEEIVAKSSRKRVVHFIGQLDQIKLDGKAHLRELKETPRDYRGQTLTFSFPIELLGELLEVFGKTVRITAREDQTPSGKSFFAIDVEIVEA